jgi:hypothetical protein
MAGVTVVTFVPELGDFDAWQREAGATPHKKAAKEKGRLVSQTAFPVLRQLHIVGRFQDLCTGGLSPSRILIGCRCKSGQSRTVARTDAMISISVR